MHIDTYKHKCVYVCIYIYIYVYIDTYIHFYQDSMHIHTMSMLRDGLCQLQLLSHCTHTYIHKADCVWVGRRRSRPKVKPRFEPFEIAFFALHKRGWTGFSPRLENFAANSNAISFTYTFSTKIPCTYTPCRCCETVCTGSTGCTYFHAAFLSLAQSKLRIERERDAVSAGDAWEVI